jgi:hypothetical protein
MKKKTTEEDRLSRMSVIWPVPDQRYFQSLDISTPKEHNDRKKMF